MISPVIKALLIANGVLFLGQMAGGSELVRWLGLWPVVLNSAHGVSFLPWQIVTYSFLHGGLLHLGLNMYVLWMFGTRLEMVWGSRRFAVYYFTCVVVAGLSQLVVASMAVSKGVIYPTIGASGGVFGLLLAFGVKYPDEIIRLLFPPIALKAKWFVILYGAFELFAGVTGTLAGVAHFAHLGGMLGGFLLLKYWDWRAPRDRT